MITWWPGLSLEQNEKQVIEAAFAFYKKNKTATAASLGISIRTLDAKLERYEELNGQLQEAAKKRQDAAAALLRRQRGIPEEQGANAQPAPKVPAQQQVPVRKDGAQVQEVLPTAHASANSQNRKR